MLGLTVSLDSEGRRLDLDSRPRNSRMLDLGQGRGQTMLAS